MLNALKAFLKDVAIRWEKILAIVLGKTKASCMKRVAGLKREFRSSKDFFGEVSSMSVLHLYISLLKSIINT